MVVTQAFLNGLAVVTFLFSTFIMYRVTFNRRIRYKEDLASHLIRGLTTKIYWGHDTTKCVDVERKNSSDGTARVMLWWCKRDLEDWSQLFSFDAENNMVKWATEPELCWAKNDTTLVVKECNGNSSTMEQKFWFDQGRFMWAGQGELCLDVPDGNVKNNKRLGLWDCHHVVRRPATFTVNSTLNQVQLRDFPGKCLDVEGGKVTNGAALVVNTCDRTRPSQQFSFTGAGRLRVRRNDRFGELPYLCIDSSYGQWGNVVLLPCGVDDKDAKDSKKKGVGIVTEKERTEQLWSSLPDGTLRSGGFCMDASSTKVRGIWGGDFGQLHMKPCKHDDTNQLFITSH
eukprot:gnl/MRDRNA2_/MRDRNA2_188618_c0_seq1.p1 gnl/MRDRNA2_/MRDRNA2_188618_c0~~gnl/MRDRNA2_/MRDRNA2_188618_c0_seq1.p1  ORF type:complete len:342 (+),score=48.59 gnl/MRDRNA2_/MRDRNA2_188618_c0_seq1:40-1065(+)